MREKPPMKVSVAMITYNHERFIAQAIESVLAQKVNFDYEIVIGEDCSTDGTREIVMDFGRRYPNRIVPLIRDQNLGGPWNLSTTLASCCGRYVALLEGDDYWTSADKLQMQVDFLEAHPDRALCCHRVKTLNETGAAQFDVFPPHAAGPYTIEDLLKGNFVMTCSTVLRRELMRPLPSWYFKINVGDWPLFAIIARHGRIELMDEVMAAYRVHSGSIWSALPLLARLHEGARMLRALDEHLGFQYTSTIRQTITRPYIELAMTARANGKRMETAEHLVSYIRNGGLRLPINRRLLAGLAAYAVVGSWYKVFSRGNPSSITRDPREADKKVVR
jgi:glycosyltransferase involved in cell wall biosynthesis